MTFQGRSMDDLPLAAYSTGMEQEVPPEPAAPAAPPVMAKGDTGPFGAAEVVAGDAVPAAAGPRRIALPAWLVNPRTHLRDPRLLMTGVIGVGVVLLAASLLLGGGPTSGAAGPGASASARPGGVSATPIPPSGDASVEVTGKLAGTYLLAGASGTGPAAAGRIDAAWADALGSGLSISGPASAGTRTTDPTFVLTWTVAVNGVSTTFSSAAAECTVGMGVQPKSVTGSFVCKKLKSADGKLEIDLRGTYRT